MPPTALDPELSELVAAVGVPMTAATLVTRWWSPGHPRAAWHLQFANRHALKGVRFSSAAAADQTANLLEHLGDKYFPRIVARRGSAILFQWVEGVPLTGSRCRADFLRQCGFVHGWIHSQVLDEKAAMIPHHEPDWSARLEAAAETLARVGMLTHKAQDLIDQARIHVPRSVAIGITHGDFCGENLIAEEPNRIRVIDNEMLAVDALDWDIARTWYRWPMRPGQWAAYQEGYSEHRSLADFEAHFTYWSVLVLLESAVWHVAKGTDAWSIPLRRLLALQ